MEQESLVIKSFDDVKKYLYETLKEDFISFKEDFDYVLRIYNLACRMKNGDTAYANLVASEMVLLACKCVNLGAYDIHSLITRGSVDYYLSNCYIIGLTYDYIIKKYKGNVPMSRWTEVSVTAGNIIDTIARSEELKYPEYDYEYIESLFNKYCTMENEENPLLRAARIYN